MTMGIAAGYAAARPSQSSIPESAGCRPSPVTALMPLPGEACSTSWPRDRSNGAYFEPIGPGPPMITIFISSLLGP